MRSEKGSKGRETLARFMPVMTWLPSYDRSWFRSDLIAAVTVAAFAVPNLMAFSQLAGLPPQYGLYAGIGAGIGYFLFGTIKRLSMGPSASQAILVASVLGVLISREDFLSEEDYLARYLALAIIASFLTGLIFLLARVAKLGFIINLIPTPVFKGFMAGMGLTIIVSQLPKLLGVPSADGDFFTRLFDLIGHLGDVNFETLGFGVLLLVMLFALDSRFKRLPNPLIVVVFSVLVMTFTDLHSRGVEWIGDIPGGVPTPAIPEMSTGDIRALLSLAFALFILSFVETTSIGKALESKHAYRMDPDQELVALGASNIGSGLFQGFPVSASVSRSVLNDRAGARTQLSSLLMALVLIAVAVWLTGLLHNMPVVVMGVLIIVAVFKIIDFTELHRIQTISTTGFAVALVSFGCVLTFGVLEGVLIGVVISFVFILYRIAMPHMSVLGRIPDTNDFKDVLRNNEYILYPGVLIVRFDAPLVFANSHTVKHQIIERVEYDKFIELVILDMETSPILDVTASDMLGEMDEVLGQKGITFRLANCSGEVRDVLRATYSMERVGHIDASTTVNHIVDDWVEKRFKEGVEEDEPQVESD
jgi:high affinity sulfate transporter 1